MIVCLAVCVGTHSWTGERRGDATNAPVGHILRMHVGQTQQQLAHHPPHQRLLQGAERVQKGPGKGGDKVHAHVAQTYCEGAAANQARADVEEREGRVVSWMHYLRLPPGMYSRNTRSVDGPRSKPEIE